MLTPDWTKDGIDLYLGDCLDVLPGLADNSVDAVVTDPPYGTTACKWDSIIPLEPMWEQLKRVAKPNAAIVMTASQPFTTELISSNMGMFKCCWVWEKNRGSNFGNVRWQPMKEHEDVVVFGRGRITYNPIPERRKGGGLSRVRYKVNARTRTENYSAGLHGDIERSRGDMRCPSSVQKFNTATGQENVDHPTQKPVALMTYMVRTYTNEGETVLDFAMGSGTTGLAAIKTGRRFIGIEKEPKYFDLCIKRITDALDGEALFRGS